MRQKSGPEKQPAEDAIKDIRRATRRHFSAEEKIRVVLEGLRGEESIAELCRREGIASSMYYGWSKEFLEAGKRRLAGDTARAATSDEVKDLRREAQALKEVVADLTLENRLLKKSMIGDGGDEALNSDRRIARPSARRARCSPSASKSSPFSCHASTLGRPARGRFAPLARTMPPMLPSSLAVFRGHRPGGNSRPFPSTCLLDARGTSTASNRPIVRRDKAPSRRNSDPAFLRSRFPLFGRVRLGYFPGPDTLVLPLAGATA